MPLLAILGLGEEKFRHRHPGKQVPLAGAKVKKTWPLCIGRFIKGLATRPSYRRFVLRAGNHDRVFAKTLLRLWAAYETKSMRYGIFTAVKPDRGDNEARR